MRNILITLTQPSQFDRWSSRDIIDFTLNIGSILTGMSLVSTGIVRAFDAPGRQRLPKNATV